VSGAAALPARPAYFETGWTGGRSPWAIALVVSMATFMEVLDTSIANVSLPHIAGDLSVTQDQSTWVLTSYLVSNAVVLPISGWLATRIGRKRFYMMCVSLFVASSLLCGLAPTLGTLVFFRILQGIGGGGLAPSEQAILVDTFPPAKRGAGMAVYGMAVVVAPAIGPTLGGFITEHFSWRWVFFINVPVGLASLVLTNRVVTDPPHLREMRQRTGRIDYVGLGLISAGLGCLEYVLDKGQEEDWLNSPAIVAFAVAAAACIVAFVIWEWYQDHPVIDVRMFGNRTLASGAAIMLLVGVLLYAPTVLLPAFEQALMGYTAEQAGQSMSPGAVSMILLMPLSGALVSRVDPRWLLASGAGLLSASLFYMSGHLHVGIDFQTAMLLRLFQTVGFAFLFVPINALVYAGVPPQKNNTVAGIMNLGRNIGGSIGIALAMTTVARRAQVHQAILTSHTNRFDAAFTTRLGSIARAFERGGASAIDATHRALAVVYRQVELQATQLAYLDAFRVLAFAGLGMLPLLALARSAKRSAS
jgi:MFS transporter, DHA2 family, multidrug resistance protein